MKTTVFELVMHALFAYECIINDARIIKIEVNAGPVQDGRETNVVVVIRDYQKKGA